MRPTITAVSHPAVDGHPFGATGMPVLDSLTPLVSWSAPASGMPAFFRIVSHPVSPDGMGGTKISAPKAVLVDGSATSARIPPGFLSPGSTYVFTINAIACPDCDYEGAPGRYKIPNSGSNVLSNIYRTPAP